VHPQTSASSPSVDGTNEIRSTADPNGFGHAFGHASDVERALALALGRAALAGRFDVVAKLADELHARRLAAAGNVVRLPKRGDR
jgi:hypothetical protein